MVDLEDTAPDFTAPLANGTVSEFTLSEHLDEAPLVLAFFPAAFTGTCSHELETFQERLEAFHDAGAAVYGISIDTPFALNEFRDDLGLSYDLISDTNRTIVGEYDVSMDFASLGVNDVAKRSVFVVDADQTVRYAWVSDDPGIEPDYDAVQNAVTDLS